MGRAEGRRGSADAVVGDQPVVLDAAAGKLFLPGGRELPLADAREAKLQQRARHLMPWRWRRQGVVEAAAGWFHGEDGDVWRQGCRRRRCSWAAACTRHGPVRTSMSGTARMMPVTRTWTCPRQRVAEVRFPGQPGPGGPERRELGKCVAGQPEHAAGQQLGRRHPAAADLRRRGQGLRRRSPADRPAGPHQTQQSARGQTRHRSASAPAKPLSCPSWTTTPTPTATS